MGEILDEIASSGQVTFARFMELALYHPAEGYYTRERTGPGPAGPRGDFLTAPTAEPLFGRCLAQMLERLAGRYGEPVELVELGAGPGVLVERLATALGGALPAIVSRIVAVEAAGWARERIVARRPEAVVAERLADVERVAGPTVLFASELYDALPAHRVTMVREGAELVLKEYYVAAEAGGGLGWRLGPPSTPALASYLREHAIVLAEGQVAELRPKLRELHEDHLRWCGDDTVAIVVDYGYPARQLYNARARFRGTLVAYRGHEIVDNVLEAPGSLDITAHVSFDDLQGGAARLGWDTGFSQPLGIFLTIHGAVDLLPAPAGEARALSPEEWAVLGGAKRLLSPAGMGSDLKVLVHGTGRLWRLYRQGATPPPVEA